MFGAVWGRVRSSEGEVTRYEEGKGITRGKASLLRPKVAGPIRPAVVERESEDACDGGVGREVLRRVGEPLRERSRAEKYLRVCERRSATEGGGASLREKE